MARLDALYLEDPCSGSRRMVHYLANEGIQIGRDRVRNLMHRMGLRAMYQKPRTTVPGQPSERFPCLVDLKQITAVDQVWATDLTYIPMQKGFLDLVAIMDLHSSHVLSWKLTGSLDTEFCLEALEMASALAASHRSSTPIRAASTPVQTSWLGSKQRRSRSVLISNKAPQN
jgi:putative transposase